MHFWHWRAQVKARWGQLQHFGSSGQQSPFWLHHTKICTPLPAAHCENSVHCRYSLTHTRLPQEHPWKQPSYYLKVEGQQGRCHQHWPLIWGFQPDIDLVLAACSHRVEEQPIYRPQTVCNTVHGLRLITHSDTCTLSSETLKCSQCWAHLTLQKGFVQQIKQGGSLQIIME